MARVDRTFLFLNLLLLLTVSFLPFPTRLVADYLQRPGEQTRRLRVRRDVRRDVDVYNVWWRYACAGRRLIGDTCPNRAPRDHARVQPRRADLRDLLARRGVQPARQRLPTFAIAAFYLPSAALFER